MIEKANFSDPLLFDAWDRGIGTFFAPVTGVIWHHVPNKIPHLFGPKDTSLVFAPLPFAIKGTPIVV